SGGISYEYTPISGGVVGDIFMDTGLTPDGDVLIVGNSYQPGMGTYTNLEIWNLAGANFNPISIMDENGETATLVDVTINMGGFPWGDYVGAGNNLVPDTLPEWKILVAGNFTNAGGASRNGIA